jgi:hypothetical protein
VPVKINSILVICYSSLPFSNATGNLKILLIPENQTIFYIHIRPTANNRKHSYLLFQIKSTFSVRFLQSDFIEKKLEWGEILLIGETLWIY